jgi:hypothetical protein
MKIEQAVKLVVDEVKKTGARIPLAVVRIWKRDLFSDSQVEELAKEALAVRAGDVLRNPTRDENGYVEPGPRMPEIPVTIIPSPEKPIASVSIYVRVLAETNYEGVGGVRKALIQFTTADCRYAAQNNRFQAKGLERHAKVFDYIQKRLLTLGKKSVTDLAEGEKQQIARMWKAARKGQDFKEE